MKSYPLTDELLKPVLRVAMPRAGRLYVPRGTVQRRDNADFGLRIGEP